MVLPLPEFRSVGDMILDTVGNLEKVQGLQNRNKLAPLLLEHQRMQNQYYEPNIQSQIENMQATTNELNQSLPYKLQKLQNINQLAPLLLESQIMKNKYLPLDYALRANNAINYNNRSGQSIQYLRSIETLPAAEKQAYLADPNNREKYFSMVEDFRNSIGQNSNILSDEVLKNFGILQNNGKQNTISSQQNNRIPVDSLDDLGTKGDNIINDKNNDVIYPRAISQEERNLLNAQQRVNVKSVGRIQSARAEGSATLDKYLLDHRDEFSKIFKDAAKYQGKYGRAKNWLTKFKENQPEEYANYIYAKNSLVSTISNQIRFQEHMGATDASQREARDMVLALDKLDESPETSIKVINKGVKSLLNLSESIYNVAEPSYKGTYKKLYNIPTLKGEYIKNETNGNSNSNNKTINNDSFGNDPFGVL